ncbi:MAG: hypothetical protein ACLR78_05590 [Roseburia sp.]
MDLKTKMSENPDFTEKINRLQDVTIEISYVNSAALSAGERRILPHFWRFLPKLLRVYEFLHMY